MLNSVIQATMKRTILILTCLLIILVWGGISAYRMHRDYLPLINNPSLMVALHAPNVQTDQMKSMFSDPIERSVRQINGLETLETDSFNGGLVISLHFPLDYNMDRAESDASQALARVSLPAGTDKPTLTRVNSSSIPMMRLSLTSPSGKADENTLRTSVQSQIAKELMSLPGVSDVRVTGAARNGYELSIRSNDLAKSGVRIEDVKLALTGVSLQGMQGNMTNGEVSLPVQVSGWDGNEQQLKQFPIRGTDGHTVPMSAIADVAKSVVGLQTITRTDGAASVVFDVLKTPSSNITELSDSIRSRIPNLPDVQKGDVKLSILYDQGQQVKISLRGLLREGVLGCLLSMASVFLFFRNIRSTLLVALSLPICFLATTGLLNAMGVSLNMLTVSGLIVAMGRVIDDTIVILDNIYRKVQESGHKLNTGILTGAVREMLPAIVSSTATTVAVFIPIALVGGMIGSAFSGFAWSVVIALATSLLVSVLVVPALYYVWQSGRANNKAVSIEAASQRLLQWTLDRKGRIVAVCSALFLVSVAGAFTLPVNFLPANRSGQINVQLEFPERTALAQMDAAVKRMEQTIKADPEIAGFSSALGSSFTPQFDDVFDAGGGWIQGGNIANIAVSVKKKEHIESITAKLQQQLANLSGGAVCTVTNQNISGDDSQLKINLSGSDAATLEKSAMLLRTKLQDVPGLSVAGAADDKGGVPGYQIELNRETLQRTGIQPDKVYERIREFLSQGTIYDVQTGKQETIPFVIHTDVSAQKGNADPFALLGSETFKDKDGKDVRLEELATLGSKSGPFVLRERDGAPFAQVTANITSRDVEKVAGQVRQLLGSTSLPAGVHYSVNGITAQVDQMMGEMGIALSVSLVLVILVLSLVFRGWRAPVIVLVCIPPAYIGSIIGMLLSGGEWNLATFVGLLMLSGIVVTNGIVLVDKVERNLAVGMEPKEAIVSGSASRVRPVLITAATTILTLLPLCLTGSQDTVVSKSLGIVVVCGMISSTLISLLVIPILYEWMYGYRAARLVRAGLEQVGRMA